MHTKDARALCGLLRGGGGPAAASEDTSMWTVMTDMLFPLVFILAIIAVVQRGRYMTSEKVTREMNGVLHQQIEMLTNNRDPDNLFMKKQGLVLDLQRSKLKRALEKLRGEEWRRMNLRRFMEGNRVSAKRIGLDPETGRIIDDDFKLLCVRTSRKLSREDDRSRYLGSLYKRVLAEAGVRDLRVDEVVISGHEEDKPQFSDEERRSADLSIISSANRSYVHNRLIAFGNDTEKRAVELQERTLIRVFDILIAHPKALDKSTKKLVVRMLRPQMTQAQRGKVGREIYRQVVRRVKTDTQGYPFLKATWDGMAKGL
ncbi:hypothetical protein ACFL2T_01055 [Elusimicrobiota bacterium]